MIRRVIRWLRRSPVKVKLGLKKGLPRNFGGGATTNLPRSLGK